MLAGLGNGFYIREQRKPVILNELVAAAKQELETLYVCCDCGKPTKSTKTKRCAECIENYQKNYNSQYIKQRRINKYA